MRNKKLLLISLYVITVLIVIFSIYAYFFEKDATVGSLVGGLSAIMAFIIYKLTTSDNTDSDIEWFKVSLSIVFVVGIICGLIAIFGNDSATSLFEIKNPSAGGSSFSKGIALILSAPLWVLGIMSIIAGILFLICTWTEDWPDTGWGWGGVLYWLGGGTMLLVILKAFSIL